MNGSKGIGIGRWSNSWSSVGALNVRDAEPMLTRRASGWRITNVDARLRAERKMLLVVIRAGCVGVSNCVTHEVGAGTERPAHPLRRTVDDVREGARRRAMTVTASRPAGVARRRLAM